MAAEVSAKRFELTGAWAGLGPAWIILAGRKNLKRHRKRSSRHTRASSSRSLSRVRASLPRHWSGRRLPRTCCASYRAGGKPSFAPTLRPGARQRHTAFCRSGERRPPPACAQSPTRRSATRKTGAPPPRRPRSRGQAARGRTEAHRHRSRSRRERLVFCSDARGDP
jgi:hypothetical protein